ncbi:hypothetical protein A6R68_20142, partial [Neotoma lepida]
IDLKLNKKPRAVSISQTIKDWQCSVFNNIGLLEDLLAAASGCGALLPL